MKKLIHITIITCMLTIAPLSAMQQSIVLTTKEGKKVTIGYDTAQRIPTIKDAAKLSGNTITLNLIDKATLLLIIGATRKVYTQAPILKKDPQFFQKYSPADIPAQIAVIVQTQLQDKNKKELATFINTANFLGLDWLVNAATKVWIEHRYSKQEAQQIGIVKDIIDTYLTKFIKRRTTKEYSIADYIMLGASRIIDILGHLEMHESHITSVIGIYLLPKNIRENVKECLLGNNYITSIPAYAFADLPNLKQLYLQDNQIRSISKNAFGGIPQLEHLNLINDTLESKFIPHKLFKPLPNLRFLSLKGNILDEKTKKRIRTSLPTSTEIFFVDF